MTRVLTEMLLGMRLAFAGGRRGRTRTALSTGGVALGTAVLLLSASVPVMLDTRQARIEAFGPFTGGVDVPAGDTLLVGVVESSWHGSDLRGLLMWPETERAPVPPGIPAFPPDGRMYVSPALREALAAPGSDRLRAQMPYEIAGTIGDAGLAGPQELAYYAGNRTLPDRIGEGAYRLERFGAYRVSEDDDTATYVMLGLMVATLLLPVAIFIGASLRFGGDARDRRLAAIRLVGGDNRATLRIAVGESLVPTAAGLLAGTVTYLLVRAMIGRLSLFDVSVFTSDVRPMPVLAALSVAAVIILAAAMTLLGLRGVAIEPLGVVRRTVLWRGRLWWRLILPVLGLVLMYPAFTGGKAETMVTIGVIALLTGLIPLVPYLIPLVVGAVPGGPVSWQLASRQLRQNPVASTRAVTGIVVGVAGVIALNATFATVDVQRKVHDDPADADYSIIGSTDPSPAAMKRLNAAFERVDGVKATTTASYTLYDPATDTYQGFLFVGDCEALDGIADIGRCADGDAFVFGDTGRDVTVKDGPRVAVPAKARPAVLTGSTAQNVFAAVLFTPAAAPEGLSRAGLDFVTTSIRLTSGTPAEKSGDIRAAAISVDPFLQVTNLVSEADRYGAMKTALNIGSTIILLLMGLGLLLDVADRLHDRRRLLGVLAAIGATRATVLRSVMLQALVPVVAGLALAVATGIGLGVVLMRLSEVPVRIDPVAVFSPVAAGAALVLICTVAILLPAARRVTSTEQLQHE
ncbi:membrane protein [Actinoplanes italicus]|uniref:FtsX-like permease family protein n=1 Tax=Actinoplanes italicus TaxID=113567 RepID=A0A2T0KGP7_9ACTN|nr:FtsX-like permease family protein [Actinoplanes italicus]PRX22601.1 FtsX-like permease family protein [Actinoplanes italicus]GIE28121.1 membrane protein [Actinoplanes italicus]